MLSLLVALLFAGVSAEASAATEANLSQAKASYLRVEDARVADVAYKVALAGKLHCTASHPLTGLALHHLTDYAARDQAQADALYRLQSGPGILAVVAESPAARSGLLAGDVLIAVNGIQFAPPAALTAQSEQKARRKLAEHTEAQLEEQLRLGPVQLEILRDGRRLKMPLSPVAGCEARARLARSSQANGFADGRYAIMTTKMLVFIQNDDELAVALAHEIAHNLLKHPARLEDEKVPHGILRNFGKNAARVRATEEEADRLGIKLLWAAGYDVNAAIPFWRRLYAKYDPIPVPKFLRTHPSFGARERMINDVIRELGASKAAAR